MNSTETCVICNESLSNGFPSLKLSQKDSDTIKKQAKYRYETSINLAGNYTGNSPKGHFGNFTVWVSLDIDHKFSPRFIVDTTAKHRFGFPMQWSEGLSAVQHYKGENYHSTGQDRSFSLLLII